MIFPLATVYPRRWRGGYRINNTVRTHDYTSLQSLVVRSAPASSTNLDPRDAPIMSKVLSVLPVGREFTSKEIAYATRLDRTTVTKVMWRLIEKGYPITVVSTRGNLGNIYLYEEYRREHTASI